MNSKCALSPKVVQIHITLDANIWHMALSEWCYRGSVANMLITSCHDNICRIWMETILPEDGLIDLQQIDPVATQNPLFHTQRHKKRFMQRLHHIRYM